MRVDVAWPGVSEQLTKRIRVQTFREVLGKGNGRTLLDLGAGPLLFARLARDAGWKVTAVDARAERLPTDMDGITFIQSDVREFDPSSFDSITILGLLYHLSDAEQATLLAACAYTRVIVETQVHTPGYVPPAAEPWGHNIVQRGVYEGVVYPERQNAMASIGNPTSFWHTEPSLLKLFEHCGYESVTVIEPRHYSKYGTRRFYELNG